MFDKIADFKNVSYEALNNPHWADLNTSTIKVASIKKDKSDLGGFNLEAEIEKHPENLFVKVFAIKADEVNDNNDAWTEAELKKCFGTFIGVPVFTNHQNDDIEKAKGKVVHAWYDDDKHGIYIISMVDKIAYPQLARGIEQSYVNGTSMGCFHPDTPILMADGSHKNIVDISAGDSVITHLGNIGSVLNVQIHEDKENSDLYEIKVEGLPFPVRATGEHPFYTLKEQSTCPLTGKKMGRPNWVKSRFKKRFSSGAYQMEGYEEVAAQTEDNPFDFSWKCAERLQVGDFVTLPISQVEIEHDDATPELAALLGYFLAEGNFLKRNGNVCEVQFSFNITEKDTFASEVISLLKKAFPEAGNPWLQIREDRSICVVHCTGEDMCRWFLENAGEYCNKKRISQPVMFWKKDIQKFLVGAYINGDGTHRFVKSKGSIQEGISISTASETLHNQVRFILARLGIYSTSSVIFPRQGGNINGRRIVQRHKEWRTFVAASRCQELNKIVHPSKKVIFSYRNPPFRTTPTHFVMPIKSIKKVAYTGSVYNLEVSKDNSFIAAGVGVHNCQVGHSCCSACHNRASVASEYCSHVKEQKGRVLSSRIKCKYHESASKPTDDCPVCGCKKGDEKYHELKQAKVHEWNYDSKFIEDSFVVNQACHSCVVEDILNVPEVKTKLSNFISTLKKAASVAQERFEKTADSDCVAKVAGKLEIEKLNEAMGLMEIVARSMMDQKQQVSMEFLSDVVSVLSDLQEVTDELVEMGYVQLASPSTMQGYVQALQTGQPVNGAIPVAPQPQPQVPQMPEMSAPSGGSSDAGGLATITKPASSEGKIDKEGKNGKEFEAVSSNNIKEKIAVLRQKLADALAKYQLTVNSTQSNIKESENNMTNETEKTAAKVQGEETAQVTTEKQLEAAKGSGLLHPRTDTAPEGITESDTQLGKGKAETDVTSASPQVRLSNSPTTITEDQFVKIRDGYMVRHNDFPEVITEKQWDEMSRAVGSELSKSQDEHITQGQLRDLMSHHTWSELEPVVTTEKQLAAGGSTGDLDRVKSASLATDAKKIVTTAMSALVDAIANYGKTPDEVTKAAAFMNRNPQAQIKAAYLTLINGSPLKVEARKAETKRKFYFAKSASDAINHVQPVDALCAAMGDNCRGIKSDDLVDAVAFVASDKALMTKVDELAKEKLASQNTNQDSPVVDKFAAFRQAATEIISPEEIDGLYQVQGLISEVGTPTTDKLAFAKAAGKFAQEVTVDGKKQISVETLPIELKVNEEKGIFAVTLKATAKMTAEEIKTAKNLSLVKKASKNARSETRKAVVKEAQFGGGMGGDPMGGMAGGNMPMGAPGGAPAGGQMQQPPAAGVESMDMGTGDEDKANTADMEPTPPGTKCPVCSSEDVDIVDGKNKCNNCTADWTQEVVLRITNYPGTMDKGEKPEEAAAGEAGEGFALPEQGQANPPLPVAASIRITPNIIKKVAETKTRVLKAAGNAEEMLKLSLPCSKGGCAVSLRNQELMVSGNYTIGSISPLTGSTNTKKIAKNMHLCMDSGTPYVVDVKVDPKDIRFPEISWRWVPKVAGKDCTSCHRIKKAFVVALETIGSSEDAFEAMDAGNRAKTILQLKEAGALKTIKTASAEVDALGEFKLAYAMPQKHFPIETCRERIARRFGEDALAMSGPCEGKKLANCVCETLKEAEVYAEYLAVKIAGVWSLPDPMESCITKFVHDHDLTLKEAAVCCEGLKQKYAQSHEYFLEKLAMGMPMGQMGQAPAGQPQMGGKGGEVDPMGFGGTKEVDEVTEDFGSDDLDGGSEVPLSDSDVPPTDDASPIDASPVEEPMDEVSSVEVDVDDSIDGIPSDVPPVDGPTDDIPTDVAPIDPAQQITEGLKQMVQEAVDSATGGGADPVDAPIGTDVPMEGDLPDAGSEVPSEFSEGNPEAEIEVDVDDAAPVEESLETPEDEALETPEEQADEAAEGTEEHVEDFNEEDAVKNEEQDRFNFANSMKKGVISRTGQINLDLSKVKEVLARATKRADSKLSVEPAQDAVPFKFQDKGTMGNEEKFDAKAPEIKSNESGSKMGNEEPPKAEKATVPTGDQRLGDEGEQLKPELTDKITGGTGGAGGSEHVTAKSSLQQHLASSKEMTRRLAERLVAAQNKIASDKKLTEVEPTMEAVGKIRDGKTMGEEEVYSPGEPENLESKEGTFMGNEKESIDADGKGPGKFNEKTAPSIPTEKGEALKLRGIDTTASGEKSQQYKEAMRLVGRMIAERVITPEQLESTVTELSDYKVSQLKAYENRLFSKTTVSKPAKKGLASVQDGHEGQPLVSYDAQAKSETLTERIAKCFKLSKQVEAANDPQMSETELRRRYGRR